MKNEFTKQITIFYPIDEAMESIKLEDLKIKGIFKINYGNPYGNQYGFSSDYPHDERDHYGGIKRRLSIHITDSFNEIYDFDIYVINKELYVRLDNAILMGDKIYEKPLGFLGDIFKTSINKLNKFEICDKIKEVVNKNSSHFGRELNENITKIKFFRRTQMKVKITYLFQGKLRHIPKVKSFQNNIILLKDVFTNFYKYVVDGESKTKIHGIVKTNGDFLEFNSVLVEAFLQRISAYEYLADVLGFDKYLDMNDIEEAEEGFLNEL